MTPEILPNRRRKQWSLILVITGLVTFFGGCNVDRLGSPGKGLKEESALAIKGSTTLRILGGAMDTAQPLHQSWMARTVVQDGIASGHIQPLSGSLRLNVLPSSTTAQTSLMPSAGQVGGESYASVVAGIADGSPYLGQPLSNALVRVRSVRGHQVDVAILRNEEGIPTQFITFLDKKVSSTVTAEYRRIEGGWLLTRQTTRINDTTGVARIEAVTDIDTVPETLAMRASAVLRLTSAIVADGLAPKSLHAQECTQNPLTVCAPELAAYFAATAAMVAAAASADPVALWITGVNAIAALGAFHKCAYGVIQHNKNCDVGEPHDEAWLANYTEGLYASIKSQCITAAGSNSALIAQCNALDTQKWQIYQV